MRAWVRSARACVHGVCVVCVRACVRVCLGVQACTVRPASHTCVVLSGPRGALSGAPAALPVLLVGALALAGQHRADRVCPPAPLKRPLLLQTSGRRGLAPGDTLERAICPLPGGDEAGVLGKVSRGQSWGGGECGPGREGGLEPPRPPSPRSESCLQAQECNEV